MRALARLGAALVAFSPALARAEGELRVDLLTDGVVTGVGGAAYLLSEAFIGDLAPSACRWCDRPINPVDRAVRNSVVWSNTGAAAKASDIAANVLAPLSAYGLGALAAGEEGRLGTYWEDALVVTEAVVIAADVGQATKLATARERPYVRHLPEGERRDNPQDNISFFSGHTRLSFSLAVASGTVCSMRGYRLAPAVWATGLTLATAAGYLRMAADRHYFTDVTTGAVVGSAIGFGVPYLLHRGAPGKENVRASFTPLPGGGFASVSGTL